MGRGRGRVIEACFLIKIGEMILWYSCEHDSPREGKTNDLGWHLELLCVKERELQNSAKVWIAPVLRLLTFITHFLLSCEASVAGPVLVGKMLCLNLSGVVSCIQHLTPHPPPPRMSWFADGTFVRRKRAPYSKQGTKTRAGF